nr:immunoglobulin heavy chain junction region [Mus musculus]
CARDPLITTVGRGDYW